MSLADPAVTAPTRERILAAAAHILSRRGVAATRLSDIADRARIRAPAVYYYFASRDELIAEVMREGQSRVRTHVAQALDAQPAAATAMTLIEAAVAAHLRVELELSDFATAVTRNAGQLPQPIRDSLRQESSAYHALWRDLLRRAAAEGALRPGLEPGIARMLIIGALNWTAEWWHPERDSLERLIATAQSLVRHGLTGSADDGAKPSTPQQV
jgi:AcrR family transcriptional regulator